jgi:hypothetical protein
MEFGFDPDRFFRRIWLMMTRPKNLLLLTLIVATMAFYWGCEQPETILTDKNQTILHLEPERMPSTPVGMIYSLGLASSVVDDSVLGVVEVERFGYDWDSRTFLDELGTPRTDSNRFVYGGDIYDFGYILVTVQQAVYFGTENTGPVMLIDEIQDPSEDPLLMVFPHMDTLTASQAFYNMKSISDDASWGDTSTSTHGAAIWFSSVSYDTGFLQDTVELIGFTIDTVWRDDLGDKDCVESIVNILNYDNTVSVARAFGLDTIMQTAIRYDAVYHMACIDSSEPPYLTTNVTFDWLVGAEVDGAWDEDAQLIVPYDNHVQIGSYWKDMTSYGWKYRGWVVSSVIEETNCGVGDMTRPAWVAYNTFNDSLLRGIDGELLSTGIFVSLEAPDDANPYIDHTHAVPPYPGEDFLNVPRATTEEVQLVPGGGRSTGTIFIAMHPLNAVSDTTNFPLLVNTVSLPYNRGQVEAARQGHSPDMQNFYSYTLIGRAVTDKPASQVGPYLQGFPQIEVKFQRQ